MPALNGVLSPSPIVAASAGISAVIYDSIEMDFYPFACGLAPVALVGTLTGTQPVDEIPVAMTGVDAPGFGMLDWYNRIHVTPSGIDCGNIITPQTQTAVVWNAYIGTEHTLNSVTGTDDDGIELTSPVIPSLFEPLQVRNLVFSVSNLGPPNVTATFTLDWDALADIVIAFTGSRIVAWTFPPEWGRGVMERLEWKTDVMQAFDGSEQRVALRALPRRSFEFEFWSDSAQVRRKLEALLWNWGALIWALPIWTDGTTVSSTAAIGDTTVNVGGTTNRDFIPGGLAVLMTNPLTFEVVEILSVGTSSLVLARQLETEWPASTRVFPARTAYLQDRQPLKRWTHEHVHEIAVFRLTDDSECTAATETEYRGYPVLEQVPEWSQDITADYARKLAVIDFGVGGMRYDDEAGIPTVMQSHRWVLDGKNQIAAFREFLYARRGKYSGLWVPSFLPDLVPVVDIAGGGATIDVEHCFYTLHLAMAKNRRDIRIQLKSGTVYYRRITGSSELSASVERLSVDTPVSSGVALSDIDRISFMTFSRMDSDAVELHWSHDDVVEASALWRSTNNDI